MGCSYSLTGSYLKTKTTVYCILNNMACIFTSKFNGDYKLYFHNELFSSVQFSRSVVSDSCDPMNRSTPGLPVHHQLPEFTQTHVHRVGDASHLILCRPLPLLPPIPPSIRVFSNESTLRMRWPKYWSFSFSRVQLFATTWTVVCQAPLSIEFSRPEYWSG